MYDDPDPPYWPHDDGLTAGQIAAVVTFIVACLIGLAFIGLRFVGLL